MSRYSKYYVTLCIVFLFTVTWFIGSPLDWLVWVPVIFLALIYIPMSYEVAIDRESVLEGILFPIKMFLRLLLIFSLLAIIIGMIGNFLILPLIFDQEGPIVVTIVHFFKSFEQNTAAFLLWNFASFNAVIFLWAELEDRKKEIEKKEDSSQDQEE